MAARFSEHPWGYLFPLVAAGGLAAALVLGRKGRDGAAFLGSTAYLSGMLASVAFSLFPYVLPSTVHPARGLTVRAAAADPDSLKIALAWWLPGMAIASGYVAYVYRKFAGRLATGGEHY
jgi:cytochrome d ubiquinol oxidase subunit II